MRSSTQRDVEALSHTKSIPACRRSTAALLKTKRLVSLCGPQRGTARVDGSERWLDLESCPKQYKTFFTAQRVLRVRFLLFHTINILTFPLSA